ncbi:MAG TPA: FHA domain-containing protein [Xanthomonadales bacterium]|nr:FHA domain-containing protein [Xanthomonadales bacterium]
MNDELSAIDTSCTQALKTLKDEQDVLDGRVKAMDEKKGSVAESVYQRVRGDYVARRDELETQSKPLRQTAREQYAKLVALLAELESAAETVKLDRQEIELRHELGEFDKKEFDKRIKGVEAAAAEKAEWHKKAQEMRELFLGCVRSEDELRAAPVPAPAPAPAPAAVPAARPMTGDAYTTGEITPVPASAVTPAAAGAGATMVMPARGLPPASDSTMIIPSVKPGAPAPAAAPAAPKPLVSDATQMFRPSRLVPQNPEAGKTTFNLAIKIVTIGSEQGNDIKVGGPGVEPKHAQIAPTPNGYVLTDFDTKHGTRVNAEKIKERLLNNEDVVQIGAARFAFRTG